jgi:hypothetical protein
LRPDHAILAPRQGYAWPLEQPNGHLHAETQLSVGRGVFYAALNLLDRPAELYEQGNETVRSTLNNARFAKFLIDGGKVVEHECASRSMA